MNIGDRIKALRESAKITQETLANKIGTTKQTVYKYENNIITNIPSDKIELLSKALNTTPAYLMGWSEDVVTIAAHHDNEYWTQEELDEIEQFKAYVRSKRNN